MKKTLNILMIMISMSLFSQYNPSAPWMENLDSSGKEYTIDQINSSFINYWQGRDKTKRGSGYKPFMRWEYHWRNKVNEQGNLISPAEMWEAFNQKREVVLNRSANNVSAVGDWEPLGPFTHINTGSWSSGQGRVNIVAVDPTNPLVYYMGTPAGGIWKSADSGNTWAPLSDNLPQIGVSGIAIDHTNSNVIYIATGDKDGSDTYSVGVMKSIDGGLTWNTTGLSFFNTNSFCGDIIMHPSNNQILFCATNSGIFKTVNGGVTWINVQNGNFSQGNLRFKPGNPSVVYAVSKNRFYRSTNTGDSFTIVNTGLPATAGRMVMDVTPANAEVIYILSATTSYEFQGVYKSINGGTSFTKTANETNVLESSQAWFDLALGVSDVNENEIYTGCLNVWKSTNGGTSFTKINNWSAPFQASYTHADIHYLGFQAGKLFCGSDGGIYVSDNGGISFTDKTAGAQISQFYKVSVSKQTATNIVGGLQDNGGHAYSGGLWKNYYGADGMDTAVSPTNQNLYYGFIQNGSGLYISNNAGTSLSSSVNSPSGTSGNWVTPLVINTVGEVFSGFNALYKLNGSSWQLQNTAGNTGSGNIDLITIDPTNDDIMYVVNESVIYKSINRGITFDLLYNFFEDISAIDVHSSNGNILYVATSGSNGQVYKSIDGGINFSTIATGLPNIGKNTIVHQGRNTNNPIYVGTSLGVYYIDDTMTTWQPFGTNLPNVSVTDLEINLEDSKLIAATYGRGIWQSDIPVQLPPSDLKLVEIQSPNSVDINCGNTITPQIEVENKGIDAINVVTVTYEIDGITNSFVWNGNLPSGDTVTITLPNQTLTRGVHNLNITSTTPNDAYSDNNSRLISFYINDAGVVGQTNSFSNTSDELITYNEGSDGSQWVRGIRASGTMSSDGNTVYTTNLTGEYPNNIKSYIVSQCYDLTNITNPQIQFAMKYDLEQNWDVVYVEYSTNFGQDWNLLGEQGPNWYNSNRTNASSGAANDCNLCPGGQWTGTNTSLTTYFYSLNALSSEQNVIFRIVFNSDYAVTELGVNIDDFVITGVLSNSNFELNNISIYPNPSTGIFNVSLGNITPSSVEVYDLTGKIILSKKDIVTSNSELAIDLSSASQGVYFVKIIENQNQIVKRIIKQ